MSADLVQVLHQLRTQLNGRGMSSMRLLGSTFRVNDTNRTTLFTFQAFEQVLAKSGLFAKRQELSKLYRHLDKTATEQVSYPDFLELLHGDISARRISMIRQVFAALDTEQTGAVSLRSILSRFDPTRHHLVLAGTAKPQDIMDDFTAAFEGAGDKHGGYVTADEFEDYMLAISTTMPFDDQYFITFMERAWNVRENAQEHTMVDSTIRELQDVLREKIRQKTRTNSSELDLLRTAFKHFDLENSGFISYPSFVEALKRFGIVLEPKSSRALFEEFDEGRTGQISYLEFSSALYQDDVTAQAYTQRLGEQKKRSSLVGPSTGREYYEDRRVLVSSAASRSSASPTKTANLGALTDVVPTVVFVLGGPGSGKGTQCAKIVEEFGFVHLSAGDLLRAEQASSGPYSQMIGTAIKEGKIVPVDITIQLLRNAIQSQIKQGKLYFLVDGFPRNRENLSGWERVIGSSFNVPLVLYFDCPESTMFDRMIKRGQTSGRADDNAESAKKRLLTFQQETQQVLKHFAVDGRLRVIDANQSPEQVYSRVRTLLSELN